VAPDLGAKVDGRKGRGSVYPNVMEDVHAEGSYEMERVMAELGNMGDIAKKVSLNKFFLGDPNFLTMVIGNGVLMGVLILDKGASGGGKEVGKKVG